MRPERLSMRKQVRVEAARKAEVRAPLGRLLLPDEREALPFLERACTSKLPFRSKASAVKWLRLHPRSGSMSKTVPYLCPHCGSWHTTKARP